MNIKTRNTSLLVLGLTVLLLTGCEAAEQSAQELLDETVANAMDQINGKIDGLQDDVDKTLGKPEQEEPQTEQEADEPTLADKTRIHEA
jgi:hypothetical protein